MLFRFGSFYSWGSPWMMVSCRLCLVQQQYLPQIFEQTERTNSVDHLQTAQKGPGSTLCEIQSFYFLLNEFVQYLHNKNREKVTVEPQSLALRKHAYSNTLKILQPKTENFQIKNSDFFHISAQNIDCGYSLEPPRRGGSNEYPQSMFWAEIRKIMYTPVNPSFTI